MATRAPTSPTAQKRSVIDIADVNCAGSCLLLKMAAQTKRGVTRNQQTGIYASVRVVTGDAAFAHGFMRKHKRPGLRRVTPGANVIKRHELRSTAGNHIALVWIMAIGATHLAFDDRMMRWQIEFRLLVHMALKTDLRRFARIDDGVGRAAGFNVKASRPVTGFTTNEHCVGSRRFQMIMSRRVEAVINVLMTLLARFRADISRSRNLWRNHFRPIDAAARNDANAGQRA